MPLQVNYPSAQPPTPALPYPFPTGYADLTGVADSINASTWDPTKPNAWPPAATVNRWLAHGTSLINAALAARGYDVPIHARGGYVAPTGQLLMNGMAVEVYLHLEKVAIAYAVAQLHSARAAAGLSDDKQAMEWMTEFNDYITRLESGADNMTAWGTTGTFPPEIDPAAGVNTGNLGAMNSNSSYVPNDDTEGPWFWKAMEGVW